MKRFSSISTLYFIALLMLSNVTFAQEKDKYILGNPTESLLQIKVHVIGEVRKPGEYIVGDQTNVVEILSKAGGTTDFSNLGAVVITRYTRLPGTGDKPGPLKKEIIKYNVNDYLKKDNSPPAPVLKPGDIISVGKNKWNTWRTVAQVVRDMSVVISAYLLYLRTIEN